MVDLSWWLNKQIQIPAYYDMWMRGARYGIVVKLARNGVWVKLDKHPKPIRIAGPDLDNVSVID